MRIALAYVTLQLLLTAIAVALSIFGMPVWTFIIIAGLMFAATTLCVGSIIYQMMGVAVLADMQMRLIQALIVHFNINVTGLEQSIDQRK